MKVKVLSTSADLLVLNDNRYDNGVVAPFYLQYTTLFLRMEDGGVDTTVIDRWQQKMRQMTEIPPLLASSIFDLPYTRHHNPLLIINRRF